MRRSRSPGRGLHYLTEEELDRLGRFPWRAMVIGSFLGLLFGFVPLVLVLVLS